MNSSKVAKILDSGEYYKSSIEWYEHMYLHTITERAISFITTIAVIILLSITALSIHNLFPLKNGYPFVVGTEQGEDAYPIISKISASANEAAQHSIAKYLVEKYVEYYESFSYKDLKEQKRVIENNSSRRLFSNFVEYMDISNPNSPLLRLKRNGSIRIKILDVRLDGIDSQLPDQAKVTIESIETIEDQPPIIKKKVITMEFTLSNILLVSKNIIPLEFMVRSYKTS